MGMLSSYLDKKFEIKYGNGSYQFYRCASCNGVVSNNQIAKGSCTACGGVRVRPTMLNWKEKVKVIWSLLW